MIRFKTMCAVLGVLASGVAAAQSITIRLVDGKTGKPMKNKNVTVIFCPDCFRQTVVRIEADGSGHVNIPAGAKTATFMGGPKDGAEPGRIPYIDCNSGLPALVDIAQILQTGISPDNGCGKAHHTSRPGEIVFWAHSLPWWQPDFQ